MTWGLRLSRSTRDQATVWALAHRAPALVPSSWKVWDRAEDTIAACDALHDTLAAQLLQAGLPVVPIVWTTRPHDARDERAVDAAVDGGVRRDDVIALAVDGGRVVHGLLSALRPIAQAAASPIDAVVFRVARDSPAAHTLVQQLLHLGRADAQVCELQGDDGLAWLLVHVQPAPMWLVWRAHDDVIHGDAHHAVQAYVSSPGTHGHLLVPFAHEHPLGALLDDELARAHQRAFVQRDGTLWRVPQTWPLRAIHDVVRALAPPAAPVLHARPLDVQFTIRLQLGAAERSDPELFLLEADALPLLEEVVDGARQEELSRLSLARVGDDAGRVHYVVREAIRAQSARLSPRLAAVLQRDGFVRVPAVDNLYVPVGTRLVPALRRDDLRTLFGLDEVAADGGVVVVQQDGDGLRTIVVRSLNEVPLSQCVRFIATDRRFVLDRLFEEAVLTFPQLSITRAPPAAAPTSPRPAPKTRAAEIRIEPVTVAAAPRSREVPRDVAALQVDVERLQARLLQDAPDDAHAWHELGVLHEALGDHDDALACIATALFWGEPAAGTTWMTMTAFAAGSLSSSSSSSSSSSEGAASSGATVASDAAGIVPRASELHRMAADLLHPDAIVDDEMLRGALRVWLRDDLPIARRLQWAVLRALFVRAHDVIGLTRGKEVVLGAMNARGLTASLDVPRFVRTRIAWHDNNAEGGAPRSDQLATLMRLRSHVLDDLHRADDRRTALIDAIFLVGRGRLGAPVVDEAAAMERGLRNGEPVIELIGRLYVQRLPAFLTAASAESWKAGVDALLARAPADQRRIVEWWTKRSLWLRVPPPPEPTQGIRPAIEKIVREVEGGATPEAIPDAALRVAQARGCYDYEVAASTERLLQAAMASARDAVTTQTTAIVREAAARVQILAHRARILGACVRAAATVGDVALVHDCLQDITQIAKSPQVPSTRDLLWAVRPALFALRRVGALQAARDFLDAFEQVTTTTGRETGPLGAALAQGWRSLGDEARADALLLRTSERLFAHGTQHVERCDAAISIVQALRHWPMAVRVERLEQLAAKLSRFIDTFTTSPWFGAHQLLVLEQIIECIIDDDTVRSDRVQAWLDDEEARMRRRILHDWRAAMQHAP